MDRSRSACYDVAMKRLVMATTVVWFVGAWVTASALTPAEQALMESAYLGKLEEVKRLVSEGAAADAVDAEKRTALMWAAFNGHASVVGYLLEKGAKLEARDGNGRTALMYSSSGPFQDTVELLMQKGAEVNVQGELEGFTALMTAAAGSGMYHHPAAEGQLEVVRLLLAYGADPELQDKDDDTAETFARQNGHSAVIDLLESDSPPSNP